jgi:hypothetical protein
MDNKYPVMTKGIFILSVTRKNRAIEEQGKGADHGGNKRVVSQEKLGYQF